MRTLVDHLGGTIGVTSEMGRGTTFTVEVPVAFEAPDDERRAPAPLPEAGQPAAPSRPQK